MFEAIRNSRTQKAYRIAHAERADAFARMLRFFSFR